MTLIGYFNDKCMPYCRSCRDGLRKEIVQLFKPKLMPVSIRVQVSEFKRAPMRCCCCNREIHDICLPPYAFENALVSSAVEKEYLIYSAYRPYPTLVWILSDRSGNYSQRFITEREALECACKRMKLDWSQAITIGKAIVDEFHRKLRLLNKASRCE